MTAVCGEVEVFVDHKNITEEIGDDWSVEDQTNGGSYRFTFRHNFAENGWQPKDYSPVVLRDVATSKYFWGGRTAPYALPGWDGCYGIMQYTALGGSCFLSDEIFDESNAYGPRGGQQTVGTSNGVTILTPKDAVLDALRKAPGITGTQDFIKEVGGRIEFPTQNTLLRTPREIVESMANLYAYLGTPVQWQVRPYQTDAPALFWGPLNLNPRYEVTIGPGKATTIDINHDPDKMHNKVIATYGRDQAYVSPNPKLNQAVSYDRIPIIRTLAVDISSTQIGYGQYAKQIAEGMLQKAVILNYDWTYVIHVPVGEPVYQRDLAMGWPSGYISPWLLESGWMIRIKGMGRFPANQPPSLHYIRGMVYDNKEGMLHITCGEPAEIAALVQIGNIGMNIRPADRVNNPSAISSGPDGLAKIGAKVPNDPKLPVIGPGPGPTMGGLPTYGIGSFVTPVPPPAPLASNVANGVLAPAQPVDPKVTIATPQTQAQSPAGFVFNINGTALATVDAGASMVMPVPCLIGVYSVFISKAMNVKISVAFGTMDNVRITIDTAGLTANQISDWRKPDNEKPVELIQPTAIFARITEADASITDIQDHLSITFAGPKAWPGCPDIQRDDTGDLVYKNVSGNSGLGQLATSSPAPAP